MLPCVLLRHIGGVSIQGETNAKQHPVLVETVDNTPGVDNRGSVDHKGALALPGVRQAVHSDVTDQSRSAAEPHPRRGNTMYKANLSTAGAQPVEAANTGNRASRMRDGIYAKLCLMDAKARLRAIAPEEGAATAEYAVVLVAATGFAALLVTIMKSDTVRKMLLDIVKQALSMGG